MLSSIFGGNKKKEEDESDNEEEEEKPKQDEKKKDDDAGADSKKKIVGTTAEAKNVPDEVGQSFRYRCTCMVTHMCICICIYICMCLYVRPPVQVLQQSSNADPNNPISVGMGVEENLDEFTPAQLEEIQRKREEKKKRDMVRRLYITLVCICEECGRCVDDSEMMPLFLSVSLFGSAGLPRLLGGKSSCSSVVGIDS